jgi:hypothetical protein
MASTVLKAKLRFKHSLVGGSLVTHGVAASAARERGVVSLASARRIRNTTSRKRADEASMQLQGREDKSAKGEDLLMECLLWNNATCTHHAM